MSQEGVNWYTVTRRWDALASGTVVSHQLAKKLAKKLLWASVNVIINGNDLFEMWKQVNVDAEIDPRDVSKIVDDVDVAVSVFLWSLQDANLVNSISPALVARSESSDVVELAWGVVYGGKRRYLVLRITRRGIASKTRSTFRGNLLHGVAVAGFG